MAKHYPTLAYRDLTPREADFMHPRHWGGQTIGTNPVQRHKGVKLGPKLGAKMLFESERMHDALRTQYPEGRVQYFGPGDAFVPAEHAGKIIVLDQSTLLSRAAFRVEPTEFPPHPSYLFPEPPPREGPIFMSEPHSVLVREPSPLIRTPAEIRIGNDQNGTEMDVNVRGSSLGNRVSGLSVQVGVLAMPDVIEVGAVTHSILPGGGQEMLELTHNVWVYPRIGQGGKQ